MPDIDEIISSCGENYRVVIADKDDYSTVQFYNANGDLASLPYQQRVELVEAARTLSDIDLDQVANLQTAAQSAATALYDKADQLDFSTQAVVDAIEDRIVRDRPAVLQDERGYTFLEPDPVAPAPTGSSVDEIKWLLNAAGRSADRAGYFADELASKGTAILESAAPTVAELEVYRREYENLENNAVLGVLNARDVGAYISVENEDPSLNGLDIIDPSIGRLKLISVVGLAVEVAELAARNYRKFWEMAGHYEQKALLRQIIARNETVLTQTVFDDRAANELTPGRVFLTTNGGPNAAGDYFIPETFQVDVKFAGNTILPTISGVNNNDVLRVLVDDLNYVSADDVSVSFDAGTDNGDGTKTVIAEIDTNGDDQPDKVIPIIMRSDLTPVANEIQDIRTGGKDYVIGFDREGEDPGAPGAPPLTDPEYNDGCLPLPVMAETNPWIQDADEDFEDGKKNSSPLVLDLDGDGIEILDLGERATYFDRDLDGFAERTAWVASDDALLVLDHNGNGRIDDHSELFGTDLIDGFSVLAGYDDNLDGLINAADAVWSDLQLWTDLASDGFSFGFELFSLDDAGITQISLSGVEEVSETLANQAVSHRSTFEWADGTQGQIADVWFDYDNVDSQYAGSVIFGAVTNDLPSIRGYGILPSLRTAMSFDTPQAASLFRIVAELASRDFTGVIGDLALMARVEEAMFLWAGAEDLDPASRGSNGGIADARQIAFLEALFDEAFLQRGWSADPYYYASIDLQRAFSVVHNDVFGRLLAQTDAMRLFTGLPRYDPSLDRLTGVTGLSQTYLDQIAPLIDNDETGLTLWQTVVRIVEFGFGLDRLDTAERQKLDDAISTSIPALDLAIVRESLDFRVSDNEYIAGTRDDDTLQGTILNDEIFGDYGNDLIEAGIGADLILGAAGDDTLVGQTGSDLIFGFIGADTYRYKIGDGVDTYDEDGNDIDRIVLGPGITPDDVTLARASNSDLIILIDAGGQPGSITVEGQFNEVGHIEILEFSDGTEWALDQRSYELLGTDKNDKLYGIVRGALFEDTIMGGVGNDEIFAAGPNQNDFAANHLEGQEGDDRLIGARGDDTLNGGEGADFIYADNGNDDVRGGAGNDTIADFAGNDTYRFDRGDGRDEISEGDGTADQLVFGQGILPDDITLSRFLNATLWVQIDSGGAGEVFVTTQFENRGAIETFAFDSGDVLDLSVTELETYGTDLDDTIYGIRWGGSPVDRIHGMDGDDELYAQAVNSFEFNQNFLWGGDGADSLYGSRGDDMLDGGVGADVISADSGDDELLGDAGADTLRGGFGNDTLDGGADDDSLSGGDNDDEIAGGSGEDTLIGGKGADDLDGGEDSDVFYVDMLDIIEDTGQSGHDIVWFEQAFGVDADIALMPGIEQVSGFVGNDTLTASSNTNALILAGDNGNDRITGGTNDDLLFGDGIDDSVIALMRAGEFEADFIW